MPGRFRRRQRLRTRAEFDRVFRRGRRLDGPLFQLVVARGEHGEDRLGLAVSRRVGGAVARNRAKRLLRESFRLSAPSVRPPLDIVVIAKAELARSALLEVRREWASRLERAAIAVSGRSGPAAVR